MRICGALVIFAIAALTSNVSAQHGSCLDQCRDRYRSEDPEGFGLSGICQQGCQFYALADSNKGFFGSFSSLLSSPVSPSEQCSTDCQSIYFEREGSEREACSQGCLFQESSFSSSREERLGDDDSGFSISFSLPTLPGLDSLFPASFSRQSFPMIERQGKYITDEEEVTQKPFFDSIFDSMNNNMKSIMEMAVNSFNLMNGDKNNNSKEPLPEEGTGKLVVIKSGWDVPGQYEEKVYDINPRTGIKEVHNDMMEKENPLEKLPIGDEAEIITEGKAKGDEAVKEPDSSYNLEVLGPFVFPINGDDQSNAIEDYNGPKLPGAGLRPSPIFDWNDNEYKDILRRLNIVARSRGNICEKEPAEMTWSEWFSCLHSRVAFPRWMLAGAICLFIFFTIWLCLMIPSSAARRKAKRAKKSVAVKELVAGSPDNPHLAIISVDKTTLALDLPPPYLEVTKVDQDDELKRAEDFDVEKGSPEAGPLPEKVPQ